ncbi:MAG: hypothetical protein M3P10_01170 [Actinomycetota bacterium]|nr:hypothetical protein [Actinomycetota bacterium]
MPEIEVSRADVEQFLSRFLVRLKEGDEVASHVVMLSAADYERLGSNYRSPEEFVQACFEFLLAREPQDQILGTFDISQISVYFPEFEAEIDKPAD